jgi:hypothetical protein
LVYNDSLWLIQLASKNKGDSSISFRAALHKKWLSGMSNYDEKSINLGYLGVTAK